MASRIDDFDVLPRGSWGASAESSSDPDAVHLRQLGGLFLARWKTILGLPILSAAVVYFLVSLIAPTYTAQAKLVIDSRRVQVMASDDLIRSVEPSEQIINGEIAVLRSNILLEDVIRDLGFETLAPIDPSDANATEAQRIDGLIWAIRDTLSVYAETSSYVVVIEFSAGDPALASTFVNAMADRYIANQVDSRRDTIGQVSSWIEDRIAALEAEVADKEEAISKMQTASLLANGGTPENAAQQITTLNNQLVEASAARVTAKARYEQLNRLLIDGGIEEVAAVVSSPAIESLRRRGQDLQQQDATWAQTVGPDHPRRAPILADLAEIRSQIAAAVRNVIEFRRGEYEVAVQRERSLQASILRMEERLVAISRGEIGLRQLERETDAARRTYEALLARLTETRTQERLQRAEATLIERATEPGGPSAPRPKLMGAMAGSVALLGVTLAIFLSDMTATTFRNRQEVEAETGLPLLASLPMLETESLTASLATLREDPFSVYGERIRQLRTTLLMSAEGQQASRVMVLSSRPGEGKTLTALALADMSVRAHWSTILVDCDLRRSPLQQTFKWNMPHDIGDLIRGECDLADAIITPDDLPFDVLTTAGPNPETAEELSVSWLEPIFNQLSELYDVVIIDGPPLLAVPDSILLAQAADRLIYVAEHDATERSDVQDGLAMLQRVHLQVDGIVLNKVQGVQEDTYRYG